MGIFKEEEGLKRDGYENADRYDASIFLGDKLEDGNDSPQNASELLNNNAQKQQKIKKLTLESKNWFLKEGINPPISIEEVSLSEESAYEGGEYEDIIGPRIKKSGPPVIADPDHVFKQYKTAGFQEVIKEKAFSKKISNDKKSYGSARGPVLFIELEEELIKEAIF